MINELISASEEISNLPDIQDREQYSVTDHFKYFLYRSISAIKLILTEKENIVFAILQWVVIGLVYYLWVQIFRWFPESWWNSTDRAVEDTLNIIFVLWSIFCVGLAALPIGILTGCMGASQILKRHDKKSTIAGCLKIVSPKTRPLWLFHWADGVITVMRILDRIPTGDKESLIKRVVDETIYYAWKIGTIGIVPSILNGRSLVEAAEESVDFVKNRAGDVILLRGAYSAICWVVGIAAYFGSLKFYCAYADMFTAILPKSAPDIYHVYFIIGFPILAAVGVVIIFLRPIFIISSCELYAEYLKNEGVDLSIPPAPPRIVSILVSFAILALIIYVIYWLGIQFDVFKIFAVK